MQVGNKVRHKKTRRVAYIKGLYSDIEGGVILDREIDGFRSWNVQDLTLLKRTRKVPQSR